MSLFQSILRVRRRHSSIIHGATCREFVMRSPQRVVANFGTSLSPTAEIGEYWDSNCLWQQRARSLFHYKV